MKLATRTQVVLYGLLVVALSMSVEGIEMSYCVEESSSLDEAMASCPIIGEASSVSGRRRRRRRTTKKTTKTLKTLDWNQGYKDKKTAPTAERIKYEQDSKSWEGSCPATKAGDCYGNDVTIDGKYQFGHVNTVFECKQKCKRTLGCNFFVFWSDGGWGHGNCFPKHTCVAFESRDYSAKAQAARIYSVGCHNKCVWDKCQDANNDCCAESSLPGYERKSCSKGWVPVPVGRCNEKYVGSLFKCCPPEAVIEPLVEQAQEMAAAAANSVTTLAEVKALIGNACPNNCKHGCVMMTEQVTCSADSALPKFGVCLNLDFTLSAQCILKHGECVPGSAVAAGSSRLLLGSDSGEVSQGSFNYYTKVCGSSDKSGCKAGSFMGKIEWNTKVMEKQLGHSRRLLGGSGKTGAAEVQIAKPGECKTRCDVMSAFAAHCPAMVGQMLGTSKTSSSRRLLGGNSGAQELSTAECEAAVQGAFGCKLE